MTALARETDFDIPARDGKDVYCRLNYADETPTKKAVVLAHGLTGDLNEYIHLSARDFFNEHGYDVYRISFYCDGGNHRNLQDTTLQTQANDMNDALAFIKGKHDYDKFFVCGHSYGGATTLFANPDVTAISLWDSTFDLLTDSWTKRQKDMTRIDDTHFSQGDGLRYIFGYDMLNEAKETSIETMIQKAKNLTAPTNCISVEFGHELMRDELFKALEEPKEFIEIKGANHSFTNGDTAQNLFNATHNWFERF